MRVVSADDGVACLVDRCQLCTTDESSSVCFDKRFVRGSLSLFVDDLTTIPNPWAITHYRK